MDFSQYTEKVRNYKVRIASRYRSIDIETIGEQMPSQDEYLVSTKYDGHFFSLVKADKKVCFLNQSGKLVEDHPLLKEAAEFLKDYKQAIIPGELYVSGDERTRSFQVTKALSDGNENLKFAAFDILELNDKYLDETSFQISDRLGELFPEEGKGGIHSVHVEKVEKKSDITKIFDQKVNGADLEGIVVKSIEHTTYKIKPKYTFDAVIIGFAEGDGDRAGMVRDFLLAFMKEDGSYQIFAHMSHGMDDEMRKEMLERYSKKVVDSEFIEVARNKVGFQMVEPDTVVEFSCLDVIPEDSSGIGVRKMNLSYTKEGGYKANGADSSISVSIPVFLRFRDDKVADKQDVRFAQVEDFIDIDKDGGAKVELKKSVVIARQAFSKISKENTMVRKWVVIQTNKGSSADYPNFVIHYTDFSPGRAEPLKRDVKVSDSKDQILAMLEEQIEKNIKKGWVEYT
jgi:ATP-dependent DNA ligase